MLERADQGVGRILDLLDRLKLTSQHAGHLHQRQRRRVAVAQRATLSPQVDALGRRHPRSAADALARPAASRNDVAAGGHHHGPDGVDPGGCRSAAAAVRYRPEGIDLVRALQKGTLVERTLFWRVARPAAISGPCGAGRGSTWRTAGQHFIFNFVMIPANDTMSRCRKSRSCEELRALVADVGSRRRRRGEAARADNVADRARVVITPVDPFEHPVGTRRQSRSRSIRGASG